MERFESKIRYTSLFGIYHSLLTHTQIEIGSDYFLADLSISEIAENRKISRSAVEDAIKKTSIKLDEFESSLHIYEKRENILKITAKLGEKALNNTELEQIESIEKELEYGVWELNR